MQAARWAFAQSWGTEPVDIGVGGSIPFIADLLEVFPDAAILVTGVEDPDSRAHGANESVHLGELEKVVLAEALLLERLASGSSSRRAATVALRRGLVRRRAAPGAPRRRPRPTPATSAGSSGDGPRALPEQVDDVRARGTRSPLRCQEPAGDHPAGDVLVAAREDLLQVGARAGPSPSSRVVISNRWPSGQRAAVRDGRRRDDGVPAPLVQQRERSEVREVVAPRDVHHLQVHAVVHVEVEVEVAEATRSRVTDGSSTPRPGTARRGRVVASASWIIRVIPRGYSRVGSTGTGTKCSTTGNGS